MKNRKEKYFLDASAYNSSNVARSMHRDTLMGQNSLLSTRNNVGLDGKRNVERKQSKDPQHALG